MKSRVEIEKMKDSKIKSCVSRLQLIEFKDYDEIASLVDSVLSSSCDSKMYACSSSSLGNYNKVASLVDSVLSINYSCESHRRNDNTQKRKIDDYLLESIYTSANAEEMIPGADSNVYGWFVDTDLLSDDENTLSRNAVAPNHQRFGYAFPNCQEESIPTEGRKRRHIEETQWALAADIVDEVLLSNSCFFFNSISDGK